MELKPGLSALVTGGGSGIGRALSLALGKKGIFVTIVDFSEEKGKEAAFLVEKEAKVFYPERKSPSSLFIRCDVTNARDMAAAFEAHMVAFGGLDICINNAGITSDIPFHVDETDGRVSWRRTIDVNFVSVVECTRLAIQAMRTVKKPGVIINLGSASGLYPFHGDPIYSGTKGGVVMFTRSLAYFKREGIRINVLCPEFIQTELSSKVNPRLLDLMGGFMPLEMVVDGAFELIRDESKAGSCLWITKRRGMEYWPTPTEERKYLVKPFKSKRSFTYHAPSRIDLPSSFEKIIVHILDHNFRSATKIVRTQLNLPIKIDHVLVKVTFAGVNASDVNFSSGRYFGGKKQVHLPFDAGFEAVGLIAAVGDSVHHLKVGTPVAIMVFGSYAEFVMVPSKHIMPVPRPDPEVVAMLTSGLTASIALETAGKMESGEVVLVTAAAGGTGQFAVQLAKLAGNKVVATCGGENKAVLLKSLGVDRVIDYKKENIKSVLKKEFPEGVNIIYESIGGEMFDMCLNALAMYGRLIVIGMISQYQGEHGWKPLNYTGLCEKILAKSQTVAGFFLVQYAHLWQQHMDRLFDLYSAGKLKVAVDPKKFLGLGSVADAVEYLHSGESHGKVNVEGLKNVLQAFKEARTLQKIIYTSSFFALGPTDGYVADEKQVHHEKFFCTEYERSKSMADKIARQAALDGLPIILIYPGVIYGSGKLTAGNVIARMIIERFNGRLPGYVGYGGDKMSFCHVEDVASGHIAAMHKGRVGERYLLTGENASLMRVFDLAAIITETKRPQFHIPLWLVNVYGWVSVFFAHITGKLPLISYPAVKVLRHQWAYSCEKAKEELGYTPRSLNEGLGEILPWLKNLGLIKY